MTKRDFVSMHDWVTVVLERELHQDARTGESRSPKLMLQ